MTVEVELPSSQPLAPDGCSALPAPLSTDIRERPNAIATSVAEGVYDDEYLAAHVTSESETLFPPLNKTGYYTLSEDLASHLMQLEGPKWSSLIIMMAWIGEYPLGTTNKDVLASHVLKIIRKMYPSIFQGRHPVTDAGVLEWSVSPMQGVIHDIVRSFSVLGRVALRAWAYASVLAGTVTISVTVDPGELHDCLVDEFISGRALEDVQWPRAKPCLPIRGGEDREGNGLAW